MSAELASTLNFFAVLLAVLLAVVGLYSLFADIFLRDKSRLNRRVDDEFRRQQRSEVQKSSLFKNLSALALQDDQEHDPSRWQRFENMLDQSGLNVTSSRLLTIMWVLGLANGLLAFVLRLNLIAVVVIALAAAGAPLLYVYQKYRARIAKLTSQLPDAFDLMARVIRAGQTISHAMLAVADEFEQPIAGEFSLCYEQMNLGLAPEIALRVLAQRTGVLEMKIFVLAVIIQQQTGGNLAELLEKLAKVVRERFKVRARIQALTAEGRLSALILLLLPPLLFVVLWLVNPAYIGSLTNYPMILAVTAAAEFLGVYWIYKIVYFDF